MSGSVGGKSTWDEDGIPVRKRLSPQAIAMLESAKSGLYKQAKAAREPGGIIYENCSAQNASAGDAGADGSGFAVLSDGPTHLNPDGTRPADDDEEDAGADDGPRLSIGADDPGDGEGEIPLREIPDPGEP